MKCPKCGYAGFDLPDRCRYCGYDFSLIAQPSEAATAAAIALADTVGVTPPGPSVSDGPPPELPLQPPPEPRVAARVAEPTPPPAGTPLSVRRTAERPRTRPVATPVRRRSMFELELEQPQVEEHEPPPASPAPLGARVTSAALDLAILVLVDVVVVYLTTQIAGLPLSDLAALPLVPLALFLGGLDLAYLATFTAQGGQTLGKMALGLRVEAIDAALTPRRAVLRVVAVVASAGLGLLSAAFDGDRRALHDRLAGTRVVKVTE